MKKNFIPLKFYKRITSQMPLACIEMVVENKGRFIFVKRKDPPLKNQWWFPGGRVFFNENLLSAVKRLLEKELGIKRAKSVKFLGVGESKFKKGYFNLPCHTINNIFLVKISDSEVKRIKLDKIGHYDYKWLRNIPAGMSPYLKRSLILSRFK